MFSFKFKPLNLIQIINSLGLTFALVLSTTALAAPTGGQVVSGNAAINQAGNVTNINQSSQKAIINWQQFNIGKHETVNFNQPNANASTLNRVTGITSSLIEGALNANGKVFLVNPNGIVFSKDATVNVGGLVASTRDINNQDFLDGKYVFSGNGQGGVLNAGLISAADKGMVALLGQEVINQGVIAVKLGRVELASGNKFTLNLNGNSLTNLTVDESTYKGLVSNQGIITAQGGQVFLTSRGLDQVLNNLTNNEGIIEANRWDEVDGQVVFSGDLINVDGEITATEIYAGSIQDGKTTVKSSAVLTGDFVETSGKTLSVEKGATINANHWLIDPLDVTIKNGGDADLNPNKETVDVTTIETALNSGTNVTIEAERHITVEDNLSWTDGILSLHAGTADNTGSIFVNAVMNGTSSAGINLKYGANGTLRMLTQAEANGRFDVLDATKNSGGDTFIGKINFSGSQGVKINDATYTRISTSAQFKALNNPSGNYYLANDIALTTGWTHRGTLTGNIEGLGHRVTNFGSTSYGLFTAINGGTIRNFGLVGSLVSSYSNIGFFARYLMGDGKLENVFAVGAIRGNNYVGGLVHDVYGNAQIIHSYKSGRVDAKGNYAGGIAARLNGNAKILDSYTWADVSAYKHAGGFVSQMYGNAQIHNSKANGNLVNTGDKAWASSSEPRGAGFVSTLNGGLINNSHVYITNVNSGRDIGGFVGYLQKGTIQNSSTSANVTSGNNTAAYWVGGFVGYADNNAVLKNNVAKGNVRGYAGPVGGFAGYVTANATFNNNHYLPTSYSSTNVYSTGANSQVGGLIGRAESGLVINNSTARGGVRASGQNSPAGGLVGYAGAITLNDSGFGNFDLDANHQLQFENGAPKRLSTVNSSVWSSHSYSFAGGLIGFIAGNAQINGGYLAANHIRASRRLGGFVGEGSNSAGLWVDKGTQGNSHIYISNYIGNTTDAQGRVGGVAGLIWNTISIKNLDLDINRLYSNNHQHVGGLVGVKWSGGSGNTLVENVHLALRSDLTGGYGTGGFVGAINSGSLTVNNSSINLASHSIIGGNYVGGLVGLINSTGSLTVDDLAINLAGVVGNQNVGGVAGYVGGAINLNNTQVTASQEIRSTSNVATVHLGGLIGRAKGSITIKNSQVSVPKFVVNTTSAQRVGGLVGGHISTGRIYLENVDVELTDLNWGINAGAYVGGLIGYTGTTANNNLIKNAYVTGNIYTNTITGSIGGLIGGIATTNNSNIKFTFDSVSYTGNLRGAAHTGGLVGHLGYAQANVNNAYVGDYDFTFNPDGSIAIATAQTTPTSNIANLNYNFRGGMFGETGALTITNSGANLAGNLYARTFAGGIAGRVTGNFSANNTHIKFLGDIRTNQVHTTSGTFGNDSFTGGMVGFLNGKLSVANSSVTADSINTIHANGRSVGGLVGRHYGNTAFTISNTQVTLNSIKGSYYVGGLIGRSVESNQASSISNTQVKIATLEAINNLAGGFIGAKYKGSLTISDSSFEGNIKVHGWGGGALGLSDGVTLTIKNSSFGTSGNTFTASNVNVGGVIGRHQNAGVLVLEDLEVNFDSIHSTYYQVGGLVGYLINDNSASITNAKVTSSIKGSISVGGLVGKQSSRNTRLDITNSHFSGTLQQTGNNPSHGSGGLVGTAKSLLNISNGKVGDFEADGTPKTAAALTTQLTTAGENLGGLVGLYTRGSLENNQVAVKLIQGSKDYVGGLVGKAATTTAKTMTGNTVSLAEVKGAAYVGGLVGLSEGGLSINNANLDGLTVIGTGDYVGGLIGRMDSSGSIVNSTVTNSTISGSGNYTGGAVGYFSGASIKSVFVLDSSVSGGAYTGGVIGNLAAGSVTESGTDATVTATDIMSGGFVGYLSGSSPKVTNSYALGDVEGVNHLGGFVGRIWTGSVENVYSTGSVAGTSQVGGLAGSSTKTIKNSYSLSVVTGTAPATNRGLVGENSGTVTNSFYLKENNPALTEDSANVGVTAHDLRDGDLLKSMGWDIVIDPSLPVKLYPQLRWTCDGSGGFCDGAQPQDGKATVWVIGFGKDLVQYTLNDKTFVYDQTDRLETAWLFDGTNGKLIVVTDGNNEISTAGWTYGDDYWFTDASSNKLTSIINVADSQAGIQLFINHDDFMVDHRNTTEHTTGEINITPAQVTVTANDYNKVYDGTAFSGGAGVTYQVDGKADTGLYTGDVLGGSLVYGGNSQGQIDVEGGEFVITASGLTSATGNYEIVEYIDGKLTLNKAALQIQADAAVKTYDGEGYNGDQEGVVYQGFATGDTANDLIGQLVYSYSQAGNSCGENGCVNAGSYTIEISGLTSGNYDISYASSDLTIKKAKLTLAANNEIFKYVTDPSYEGFIVSKHASNSENGADGSFTFEALGFVGNDDEGELDASNFYFDVVRGDDQYNAHLDSAHSEYTSDNPKVAGGYLLVPTGMAAENYDISVIPGHLIISPNPVLLDPENQVADYNGESYQAADFTVNQFDANNDFVKSFSGDETYTITVTDDGEDYTFEFGLTGEAVGAKDVKYTNDEVAAYAIALENIDGLTQGKYDESGDFVADNTGEFWALLDNNNNPIVDVFFAEGGLMINKLDLTANVQNDTRTYSGTAENYDAGQNLVFNAGDLPQAIQDELASLGAGTDKFIFTGDTTNGNPFNVGMYGVELDESYFAANGDFNPANFDLNLLAGSLIIEKADLVVDVTDVTKEYDADLYQGGNGVAYNSGLVGADAGKTLADLLGANYADQLLYSGDAQNAVNVGDYTITANGLTAQNYKVIFNDGSLSITPATLTVTANDDNKVYDANAYTGGNGVVYSGFKGDDTAANALNTNNLGYAGTSQNAKDAGDYVITPEGLTANNGNYVLDYVDGELVVEQAQLIIQADSKQITYDGNSHNNPAEHTVSYTGFVGNEDASFLNGTLNFDITGDDASVTNAGSYNLMPKDLTSGNYAISYEAGVLDIEKVTVTVTANDRTETYRGTAFTNGKGVTYSGFVNGEDENDSLIDLTDLSYNLNGAQNAGEYAITPSGITATNYDFVYVDGSFTVEKAQLTATAQDDSKTYDTQGYTGGAGYTLAGFVNGENANMAGINEDGLVYKGAAMGEKNANTYTDGIEIDGLAAENYSFNYVAGELVINQAEVVIKANDASKTYDGKVYTGFTTSFDGLQGNETASSLGLNTTISYDTATGEKNAGTYAIEVSHADTQNYTFVQPSDANDRGQLVIDKAVITVTVNSQTKEYDAEKYNQDNLANGQGNGVKYSGFVEGENETNAAGFGGLKYVGDSQDAKDVGEYVITAEGLAADNYDFEYVDASLKITPKQLTITADSKSKKYDDSTFGIGTDEVFSYTADGLITGDSLDDSNLVYYITKGSELYSPTDAPKNAGVYTIIVDGLTNSNYEINFVEGILAIGNKPLVITAVDVSTTYDGENFVFEIDPSQGHFSAQGFESGESWDDLGRFVGNDTSQDKQEDFKLKFVVSVNDEGQVVVTEWKNAGEYQINLEATQGFVMGDWDTNGDIFTPDINGSTMLSGDYEIHFAPGVLKVNKADLNIQVKDENFEYNGTDYTGQGNNSLTVDGWVNGEGFGNSDLTGDLSFTFNGEDFAKNAGNYTVSAEGYESNNYEIHWFNGDLAIDKKQLNVAVQDETKIYDAQAFNGGNILVTGFVTGEDLANIDQSNLEFTGDSQGAVNAGSYNIYAEGLASDNYSFVYNQDAELTVNKKALTVSVGDQSKVYDSQLVVDAPLSYSGFEGSDSASNLDAALLGFTFNGAANAVNAGSYEVVASGLVSNNYEISYVNGDLVISKADLTITADNQSKVYNKDVFNPADYTVTYTGFVGTEDKSVLGGSLSFEGNSQTAINAGEYVITPEGLTSSNYKITFVEGELAITPAELDVVVDSVETVYNGGTQFAQSGGATVSLTNGGGNPYDEIQTFTYQHSQKDVGAYIGELTVIGVDNPNYVVKNSTAGDVTITPAKLVIKTDNKQKIQDGRVYQDGFTASYIGLQGADTPSDLTGQLVFAGAGLDATLVGDYLLTASGLTSDNYIIEYVDGLLTINSRGELDSLIASIASGAATSLSAGDGAAADGSEGISSFNSGLEKSTTRLTSMSGGAKTVTVSAEDLVVALGAADASQIRVPLGRNSKIDLLNGGVRLPEHLNQEYYLQLEPGADPKTAIREILVSRQSSQF